MITELDDEYWESSSEPMVEFGRERGTIDGHSIVEQVLAGIVILAIGAAGAHVYDKYSEKRRCR